MLVCRVKTTFKRAKHQNHLYVYIRVVGIYELTQHLVKDCFLVQILEPECYLCEVSPWQTLLTDLEQDLVLVGKQFLHLLRLHAKAALQRKEQKLSRVLGLNNISAYFELRFLLGFDCLLLVQFTLVLLSDLVYC